jgi:hypothetical protein
MWYYLLIYSKYRQGCGVVVIGYWNMLFRIGALLSYSENGQLSGKFEVLSSIVEFARWILVLYILARSSQKR